MFCEASTTAFSPEAQTLLTVTASVLDDNPASNYACFAGDCPMPPERRLPMYTSLMRSAGIFDFSNADLIAIAPSFGAGIDRKESLNYVQSERLP